MRFAEREIVLKDGRKCILKPNSSEYAEQMIRYLKETSAETDFLLRYPDEVRCTVEELQRMLGGFLEDPHVIKMIAIVDGKFAGLISITGLGPLRRLRHRCSMAIALYKEFVCMGFLNLHIISFLLSCRMQSGVPRCHPKLLGQCLHYD